MKNYIKNDLSYKVLVFLVPTLIILMTYSFVYEWVAISL